MLLQVENLQRESMSEDYAALKVQLIQQLKDTLDELRTENKRLKQENEDLKFIIATLKTAAQKAVDAWEKAQRRIGMKTIDDGEGMGG